MQQEIVRILLQILLLIVLLAISGCSNPTAVSAKPNTPKLPAAPNNSIALGKVGQSEGTAVQETTPPTQTGRFRVRSICGRHRICACIPLSSFFYNILTVKQ